MLVLKKGSLSSGVVVSSSIYTEANFIESSHMDFEWINEMHIVMRECGMLSKMWVYYENTVIFEIMWKLQVLNVHVYT